MLTDFQERVETLARMAVLTEPDDGPGLAALQAHAAVLVAGLSTDAGRDLAEIAREIDGLVLRLIAGDADEPDAALAEIGCAVERLQTALSRAIDGEQRTSDGSQAEEDDVDAELIATWIADCDGALTDLEGRLLSLERDPDDAEVVAEIRRMMHTLKGECGVLALHAAQQLFHEAETLIEVRLAAGLQVPIGPLLDLLDWQKQYITRLAADSSARPNSHEPLLRALVAARETEGDLHVAAPMATPAVEPASSPAAARGTPLSFAALPEMEENLPDFLCEAKEHLAGSEEALLSLEQDRTNGDLINTVFRAFHTIKGVAGFMTLQPIVALAHSAEQMLEGARSKTLTLGRTELDLILASCDMMARLLAVLEGSTGPTEEEFHALVRSLDVAALGGASAPASAPAPSRSIERPAPRAALPDESAAQAPATDGTGGEPAAAASAGNRRVERTVKVNTTRMDNLVTMVGELVIAQQMVVQDIAAEGGRSQRLQRTLGHMGKMIRDLQEVSMSLRMVTLKGTFQKMTRLVRDVSQSAGKQIEMVTDGDDVELDRNVVEAITDPLVHMIRNACDHGIDSESERVAAGKPPLGRVSLRAYHAGGSIVIEIADDGRGLRRDKLLAKARAKGLVSPDVSDASMPDSEVYALIFQPGFSTAEKVTDLSGRGVGMDVVRRNIEALRGKVEIRSTPGQGTTFMMRLPLTMAIIDGMVVRVGTQRYVLPTFSIQQSFRPRAEEIKTVVGGGEMVRVRDSILPIYRLNRVLKLDEGVEEIASALLVVMEADDARFCLVVDEILGQHQVVIKSLEETGQHVRGVSGGTILGDGRVALILDVSQLVVLACEDEAPQRRNQSSRAVARA